MGCLKSSTGSVLVNGSPTQEFQFHKGLCQGDPLSPFLFLLVMESLHISFSKAMHQGFFKGEWNEENLLNIVRILQCFFLASGLRINLHKCSIIGVGGVKTEEVSRKATLNCPLRCVEESRIDVKQLLSGQSLLFKWVWRFKTQHDALWVRVVKAIHSLNGSLHRIPPSSNSSTWIECVKGMIQLNKNDVDFMSFVSKKVGDDGKTMFWLDPWLDGRLLKNDYPWSFALERMKEVSVGHKLVNGLSSIFEDLIGVESNQMEDLHEITHLAELTTKPDCWVWSLNPSGLFSIASARKFIEEQLSICSGTPTRWIKLVPIKVNIMAWRLAFDKLPTRLTMSLRCLELPYIHRP
ncbi:RNA-directed DNA polymerase, eukaryota, reverse transcriptase zinc-binding domain protein, partial [Tanacetum coccineum]